MESQREKEECCTDKEHANLEEMSTIADKPLQSYFVKH
jgi:hypothetical protein